MMLEITREDISELNDTPDTDLRSLIGLLCEADLSLKIISQGEYNAF